MKMWDDDDEYGQYENDYQTFEDNCAWEDAQADFHDLMGE
jgi:hypothetical protein